MTCVQASVKIDLSKWLLVAVMMVLCYHGDCCYSNNKCIQTMDNEHRIIYNCNNVCLTNVSMANIPPQTNVLLMRYCGLQTIPIFKLNKLRILDVANNNIKYLLKGTFDSITTLLKLDLRYNQIQWNSSSVRDIFAHLLYLRTLKLSGPFQNAAILYQHTVWPASVQELHIENDNINNALLIASKFTNAMTLKIFCNSPVNGEITLMRNHSLLLKNLTKLGTLSLIKCQISDVVQNFFDNMLHLSTLNIACNRLEIPNAIHKLGQDNGLSKLKTLVLAKNVNLYPIVNLTSKNLGNLSFSSSLQRLSLQGIGSVIYDPLFWAGVPNLTSAAFGHNLIIPCPPNIACKNLYALHTKSIPQVRHANLAYLNDVYPELYPICNMPDITADDLFHDKSTLNSLNSTVSSECVVPSTLSSDLNKCTNTYNQQSGWTVIVLPYCLRTLFVAHYVFSRFKRDKKNYALHVCNNSIEEIIASNIIMGRNGWSFNKLKIRGISTLRKVVLRSSGLKYFQQLDLGNDNQLEYLDLSQNSFADMNETDLANSFGSIFPALKVLNFTHCYVEELPSNFLRKVPNLSILDLSSNRLKNFSLDLNHIKNNLTINITKNYLKSFSDEYMLSLDEHNIHFGITLLLLDNDFECACSTVSFIRWFRTTHVKIVDRENVTCSLGNELIKNINVENLQYQCDAYRRNLIISISVVSGLIVFTFVLVYIVFKYRWHLRWYIFLIKRRSCRRQSSGSRKHKKSFFSKICYLNYLGIKSSWIKDEILKKIEYTWNLGEIFFMERDSEIGVDMSEVILNAIRQSSKLVFVVGNELSTKSQINWFEFALSMSNVWRRKDIVIVLKDSVAYEDIQCKLLRSFCHPRSSIVKLQLIDNKTFWDEFKQIILDSTETDEGGYDERQPLLL